jgi:hypothetical protein
MKNISLRICGLSDKDLNMGYTIHEAEIIHTAPQV